MAPPRSEDCAHAARRVRGDPDAGNRKRAKRALADVCLDGAEAVLDMRDLGPLVDCIRLVRRTAKPTAVRMIISGVVLALLASSAIKLKIFGRGP